MTISLPGSSKKGLLGMFQKKTQAARARPTAKTQLKGAELAKLFDKQARSAKPAKSDRLSESEIDASAQLSSLRSALYNKS